MFSKKLKEVLKNDIDGMKKNYDYIFIDCIRHCIFLYVFTKKGEYREKYLAESTVYFCA